MIRNADQVSVVQHAKFNVLQLPIPCGPCAIRVVDSTKGIITGQKLRCQDLLLGMIRYVNEHEWFHGVKVFKVSVGLWESISSIQSIRLLPVSVVQHPKEASKHCLNISLQNQTSIDVKSII